MCIFFMRYIKLIIEKYGWKYIYTIGNHNVYFIDYVAELKAVACKGCPAPTFFSKHHNRVNDHIFTAKKLRQIKRINSTFAREERSDI